MATKTKPKQETIFTKKEVEERLVTLIKNDLGIDPVSVDEEGYLYDGNEALDKLIEKAKKNEL
ncbi:MAG: hypothetical protein IPL26_29945 [Leptospiraceae bacterium]|nr:hypothetical protein [Leptospiraceae bacterium]